MKRSLTFALVIYGSLSQQSGGYRYDRRLVEYLRGRGHRVEVISQRTGGPVRRLAADRPRWMERRLEHLGVDIVLEDELNHLSLIRTNRRLRAARRIPVISIIHHLAASEGQPGLRGRLLRRLESAYLRTLNGAIFNSEVTRRTVARARGSSLPGVVCMPSIDTPVAEDVPARGLRADGTLRLLSVGNLIARKRMDAVVRAIARLADPGVSLTIVGSASAEPATAEALHGVARDLGVAERVQFVGEIDDDSLSEAYREHDLFVLPSQYEGFGMVYLEAMSHGLPVIAGSAGGAQELVRDGENGYLCAPGDSEKVAERIEQIRRRNGELTRLSRGASDTARRHPSWSESFAAAERFLEELDTGTTERSN